MNTSLPTSSALSDVLSIIETKIQYLEHQSHCSAAQLMDRDRAKPTPMPAEGMDVKLIRDFDQMLQFVNQQTQELKRLQIIRCWLCEENMAAVMDLLCDDHYRHFSEENLEHLLKKGALALLRLRN